MCGRCLESLAWLGPDDTNKTTLTLIRKCCELAVSAAPLGFVPVHLLLTLGVNAHARQLMRALPPLPFPSGEMLMHVLERMRCSAPHSSLPWASQHPSLKIGYAVCGPSSLLLPSSLAVDEDVVSVVFGLMRSGDHELRCCCVDLLVMLTDGCSETEAANILGGSGSVPLPMKLDRCVV